jgi:Zn-dependent protease with chaperone function
MNLNPSAVQNALYGTLITALQDAAEIRNDQQLVQAILSRNTGALDTVVEIFSTHPNIVKRLRALQELE